MNHPVLWSLVLALVIALVALAALRRRRRQRRFVQTGLKHPTGYLKYHSDTQTKVKKALMPGPEGDAAGKGAKAVATIQFRGDIRASERHTLARLIDEVLLNKDCFSEVVVRVESPGGGVAEYGHVYGEMCRIPQGGLKLTVCIDTVAASGGYLMSLPATQIIAAPFAMVGSIGVVSFVPNVRRLLERFDIQPRTFTAGDYKRTVTLTDNATPEDVAHYQRQLTLIHDQFKEALARHRPQVDLARVATGDAWLASTAQSLGLGLIDKMGVSSDYLLELNRRQDLCEFSETAKRTAMSRLRNLVRAGLASLFAAVQDELLDLRL